MIFNPVISCNGGGGVEVGIFSDYPGEGTISYTSPDGVFAQTATLSSGSITVQPECIVTCSANTPGHGFSLNF